MALFVDGVLYCRPNDAAKHDRLTKLCAWPWVLDPTYAKSDSDAQLIVPEAFSLQPGAIEKYIAQARAT